MPPEWPLPQEKKPSANDKWPDDFYMGRPVRFVSRLREIFGDEEKVSAILKEIDETCHHCWDRDRDCQCWNDE